MENNKLSEYVELFFKNEDKLKKELEDEDFNKIKEIFNKYAKPIKKPKTNFLYKTIISKAFYIKNLKEHNKSYLAYKEEEKLLLYIDNKPKLKKEVLSILKK